MKWIQVCGAAVLLLAAAASAYAQQAGACCYGDLQPKCVVTDRFECEQTLLGLWAGPGTDCDDGNGNGLADDCETLGEPGACCFRTTDGAIQCVVTMRIECRDALGGSFRGPGTDCTDGDGDGVADACEGGQEGACCFETPNGVFCQVVPQVICEQELFGIWFGPGSTCQDNDGNGVADVCEDVRGACCFIDQGTIRCAVVAQVVCETQLAGGWFGPGTDCADNNGNGIADICENANVGACCYREGETILCAVTTHSDCVEFLGGTWLGSGTDCRDEDNNGVADACEAEREGACCYTDAAGNVLCAVTTRALCTEQFGGAWQGPGTDCADNNGDGVADACEPRGACCFVIGGGPALCEILTEELCVGLFQGDWKGPGTDCADNNGNGVADACEPRGACCIPVAGAPPQCAVLTEYDCIELHQGDWKGPGTDCTDANGNGVADLCEDGGELGACCFTVQGTRLCVVTSAAACDLEFNGQWFGPGTDCTDADGNGVADICEPPAVGACCYLVNDEVLCAVVQRATCELELNGTWRGAGTTCTDYDGNGIADVCEPQRHRIEFSVDIGSDRELSDPLRDGDEGFDPGDVYWWRGPLVDPPGRDGFKDDFRFTQQFDPWPNPPDPNYVSAAPVGNGSIQDYVEWFDLDGHDQLSINLRAEQIIPPDAPREFPQPAFPSPCIHPAFFLLVSLDDDAAPGWPVGNVPVTSPSAAGAVYGTTAGRDEVMGFSLALLAGVSPAPIVNVYGFADEGRVHESLRPNPDASPEDDDDVDSLDIVAGEDTCPLWYFSADHEARLTFDPGDIYLVAPGGPLRIVDDVIHLGLPDSTDVDAFEFAWLPDPDSDPQQPRFQLALLFSVDNDDPLTVEDESGGLSPRVVYGSYFTGFSFPVSVPFKDDIDALTAWRRALNPRPACPGDYDCDGDIDFFDIDFLLAALSGEGAWVAKHVAVFGVPPSCDYLGNGDTNGDNTVDFFDIDGFLDVLGTPCP